MKKFEFICFHDNLVTDDPYFTKIKADSLEEANEIAYQQSLGSGLSAGNYELYVNTMFVKEDGLTSEI